MTARTDQLPLVLNEYGAWVAESPEQKGVAISIRRNAGLGDGTRGCDPAGSFDILVKDAAQRGLCVSAPLFDIMEEGNTRKPAPADRVSVADMPRVTCIINIGDVTAVLPGMTDAEASSFLVENSTYIREAMIGAAYDAIARKSK